MPDGTHPGTLTLHLQNRDSPASERGAVLARKSRMGSRIARVEKFVGSRFTLACNTSLSLSLSLSHGRLEEVDVASSSPVNGAVRSNTRTLHAIEPHREVNEKLDARRRMVLKLDRTSVIDHAPTPRCCSQGLFARAQPQAQRDACRRGRAGRECTSAAASMRLALKLERHRWNVGSSSSRPSSKRGMLSTGELARAAPEPSTRALT